MKVRAYCPHSFKMLVCPREDLVKENVYWLFEWGRKRSGRVRVYHPVKSGQVVRVVIGVRGLQSLEVRPDVV